MGDDLNSVELKTEWAVISLPETCVEAMLSCKVYLDGGILTVHRSLSFQDVKEAFKKAADGYTDENATMTPTEKAKPLQTGLTRRQ